MKSPGLVQFALLALGCIASSQKTKTASSSPSAVSGVLSGATKPFFSASSGTAIRQAGYDLAANASNHDKDEGVRHLETESLDGVPHGQLASLVGPTDDSGEMLTPADESGVRGPTGPGTIRAGQTSPPSASAQKLYDAISSTWDIAGNSTDAAGSASSPFLIATSSALPRASGHVNATTSSSNTSTATSTTKTDIDRKCGDSNPAFAIRVSHPSSVTDGWYLSLSGSSILFVPDASRASAFSIGASSRRLCVAGSSGPFGNALVAVVGAREAETTSPLWFVDGEMVRNLTEPGFGYGEVSCQGSTGAGLRCEHGDMRTWLGCGLQLVLSSGSGPFGGLPCGEVSLAFVGEGSGAGMVDRQNASMSTATARVAVPFVTGSNVTMTSRASSKAVSSAGLRIASQTVSPTNVSPANSTPDPLAEAGQESVAAGSRSRTPKDDATGRRHAAVSGVPVPALAGTPFPKADEKVPRGMDGNSG